MPPRRMMDAIRLITTWFLLLPAQAHAQAPADPKAEPPEISWEAAREHVGKRCAVVGKVVMARNIGSRCFLNFHENFREHFTVVINQESFERFPAPPETLYADQRVRVVGEIIEFQGKPEIIATSPDQFTVLGADAPSTTSPGPEATTRPAPAERGSAAPAAPKPAPPFDGTVTVATYNVLNLFDEHDDPYHSDEGTGPKPREQREKLAETFRKVNADVIALQEVENRGVLEEFNTTALADLNYREVVLFEGNDERGIDVAVLSRLPIGPVTSYRHRPCRDGNGRLGRLRRDLLRVRVEPPESLPFDLFVVHLKSKGGGAESTVIRQAEAAAIRSFLDEILTADPKARFLICGDFNDTCDSEPVRTLLSAGPGALHPFFNDIPEAERETYNTAPYKSMIDFIFASPAMGGHFESGSYRIFHGSIESSGSDHNPVSARFRTRPD